MIINCTHGIVMQVHGIAAAKFAAATIGTRVNFSLVQFAQEFVAEAIFGHDPKGDRAPGQHFAHIELSPYMLGKFLSGTGRRSVLPQDYWVAKWRGEMVAIGDRNLALPTTGVAVIVYTREAFLADPQADLAWLSPETGYVLVDVLAFSGPPPTLSSHRLVRNMAGGGTKHMAATGDELRSEAAGIVAYEELYVTVGDRITYGAR